eukprot:TRINITY_DN6896_c0_g2_i2.p1 TRINITY_DN6896_c0_g2~~TRINITY_DN6896_c0_g2_i2.p1  ORF type:complete len:344 (+),score=50.21 TRINITY_DN6896_c0_g2_i2:206-1237(+)
MEQKTVDDEPTAFEAMPGEILESFLLALTDEIDVAATTVTCHTLYDVALRATGKLLQRFAPGFLTQGVDPHRAWFTWLRIGTRHRQERTASYEQEPYEICPLVPRPIAPDHEFYVWGPPVDSPLCGAYMIKQHTMVQLSEPYLWLHVTLGERAHSAPVNGVFYAFDSNSRRLKAYESGKVTHEWATDLSCVPLHRLVTRPCDGALFALLSNPWRIAKVQFTDDRALLDVLRFAFFETSVDFIANGTVRFVADDLLMIYYLLGPASVLTFCHIADERRGAEYRLTGHVDGYHYLQDIVDSIELVDGKVKLVVVPTAETVATMAAPMNRGYRYARATIDLLAVDK